jgi:hypothetical protein
MFIIFASSKRLQFVLAEELARPLRKKPMRVLAVSFVF